MFRSKAFLLFALTLLISLPSWAEKTIGINVVLKQPINNQILTDLSNYGRIKGKLTKINAVFMQAGESKLPIIQKLPYVAAANPDQPRDTGPVSEPIPVSDFTGGAATWDQDSINVVEQGSPDFRTVAQDGTGVYVAVLDTGLLQNWQTYFPTERIDLRFAKTFGAGGASGNGAIVSPPSKEVRDQNSHGTHVVSSIIGFKYVPTADNPSGYINGAAPKATIIPIKVLNQNGSGWSSAIAAGIVYVTDLHQNQLGGAPVVINMSLSGGLLDAVEKAAVDYAVARGVIIVAAASNNGPNGIMGYPGAYQPVISVAAGGYRNEFLQASWWRTVNVSDPFNASDYYLANFSSRVGAGQDMDVTGPGSYVVGPYQVNSQTSYYYLSGTSMSSPHVAGIVALMKQINPGLTNVQAESILETTAHPFGAGTNVTTATGIYTWPASATGHGWVDAAAALSLVP
jgi:subtilisin family serine protease